MTTSSPNQLLIWDAHACFRLDPNADLTDLQRYKTSGVSFVSINVGMDMTPLTDVLQVLAHFRKEIAAQPEQYTLVKTAADIGQAQRAGKLAIAFDLEGSEPLLGNLDLIALFYELGMRQMLLAYNKDNRASGGCLEGNIGLTEFGRQVIQEMNRVGMIVDLTHMGEQATLEACALSTKPVIYSHSNPAGLRPHVRNISDAQIVACARTGGVVGINGVGEFLGGKESLRVVENIEYVVDLVGVEHVGLGLDYVVDKQELIDYLENHPEQFPSEKSADFLAFVEPEQIPEIATLLGERGYSETAVRHILGENFLRVATAVWQR